MMECARRLNWFVEHVAFRDVQAGWNTTRARVGLPPTGRWMDELTRETGHRFWNED